MAIIRKSSSSAAKKKSSAGSYDDGYDDVYDNEDYDKDRCASDADYADYADGVDDAMEDADWLTLPTPRSFSRK